MTGWLLNAGRATTMLRAAAMVVSMLCLAFTTTAACSGLGTPSSEEVVRAIEDEGLPMGDIYPVEEVEGWKTSPLPKTYTEGTHFDIPGMGEGHGGQVFVFENEEDLNVMVDHYENPPNKSPMLRSHLYVENLVLLQIGGNLPKGDADAYGAVLEQEV
jgi:hypothetical protein